MQPEIFEKQQADARNNAFKSVNDLKVGDFLYLTRCSFKNDGPCMIDAIEEAVTNGYCQTNTLCKIEKIVHCSEKAMFSNQFEFGRGGYSTDVFKTERESTEFYQKNESAPSYFYLNVTLVIADTGRYIFTDPSGFTYPRYILVRDGYREMFKAEIEQTRLANAERRKARKEQQKQEREARKKQLIAEAKKEFSFLNPKKSVKANWNAICEELFRFRVDEVKQKTDHNGQTSITLYCLSENVCRIISEKIQDLEQHFQYYTGETATNDDGDACEVTRNALEDIVPGLFSNVHVKTWF